MVESKTIPARPETSAPEPPPVIDLCGLRLAVTGCAGLVDFIFASLSAGRGGWVVTANTDHLQRHRSDAETARLNGEADLVVADGMPLVWASRIRGTPLPERVAGSDLVWLVAERAAREGRSLYLLGGNPGAAEGAADVFRERLPSLEIAGLSSPLVSMPPTPDEIAAVTRDLAAARPDVVYVALGAPKQEMLIDALRGELPGVWWMGVGISLSFVSGEVHRAPKLIQRVGLEWLHRLLQEPGRLARRYLLRNLPFTAWLFGRCAIERLGIRVAKEGDTDSEP